ncbi:TIGR03905 family TSCPD domain-containing protein [Clostridium sp. cel8]|jgi:uncharacterized protein (TIGR03905 family)|uniref:TIGR03905 family TSCPD domain-containing protein n=1 Tax=unclassified Clostridium TaxID=2614128 RepID=UPI0015F64477|nr:TIGR03905 family TSCPD domain-containing protein [Clostridium sp. cel8]MBA5851218.1 TIGR03905 family TSCPD domain-containing protein [Clostridium sp. cel8]
MYSYNPKGVCSRQIKFDVIDNKIKNVSFVGGCDGNLQGISRLVDGMDVKDAVERLKGISCGRKGTSCPDQFAKAISSLVLKNNMCNAEK